MPIYSCSLSRLAFRRREGKRDEKEGEENGEAKVEIVEGRKSIAYLCIFIIHTVYYPTIALFPSQRERNTRCCLTTQHTLPPPMWECHHYCQHAMLHPPPPPFPSILSLGWVIGHFLGSIFPHCDPVRLARVSSPTFRFWWFILQSSTGEYR